MKQFTFPANQSHPGFTIDVDIRRYMQEDKFVALALINENLYCFYKNVYPITTLSQYLVLGWIRQSFPLCCGLDIVSQLYSYPPQFSEETMEKWWKWMEGFYPIMKPAIGIIPQIINENNEIQPVEPMYKWFSSKGVQYG